MYRALLSISAEEAELSKVLVTLRRDALNRSYPLLHSISETSLPLIQYRGILPPEVQFLSSFTTCGRLFDLVSTSMGGVDKVNSVAFPPSEITKEGVV